MKKIFFSLLGAIFLLTANAQGKSSFYNGDWRIDSVVTTYQNGSFDWRESYEYDASGLCTTIYTLESDESGLFYGKAVMTYNENGMVKTEELYRKYGDTYVLVKKSEVIEYSPENGLPMVIETSAADEDNPQGGVSLYSRNVITKFHGNSNEEGEIYLWIDGEWQKYVSTKAQFNSLDQIIRMTSVITMIGMGFTITSDTTYEYDSHGNVTKETSWSTLYPATITTYTYEYDANDLIYKITTKDSSEITYSRYYWSRNGETSIHHGVMAPETDMLWFDLSGRRLDGKPSKKGIYILNGKKIVNK